MIRVYLLITVLFIFLACRKETKNKCFPEKQIHFFQTGKILDTLKVAANGQNEFYQFQISPGNDLVFEYTFLNQDCPEIADDEGGQRVVFQANPLVNNLVLKDSVAFTAAKVLYSEMCFGCTPGFYLIKAGLLKIKRMDEDKWQITAALKSPHPDREDITFDLIFTKK